MEVRDCFHEEMFVHVNFNFQQILFLFSDKGSSKMVVPPAIVNGKVFLLIFSISDTS